MDAIPNMSKNLPYRFLAQIISQSRPKNRASRRRKKPKPEQIAVNININHSCERGRLCHVRSCVVICISQTLTCEKHIIIHRDWEASLIQTANQVQRIGNKLTCFDLFQEADVYVTSSDIFRIIHF